MSKSRYPEIKHGPDGKRLCRGCGGELPPRRRTWCSTECWRKYDPEQIIGRVWNRDGGRCQSCGKDIEAYQKEWGELRRLWQDEYLRRAPRVTPETSREWRATYSEHIHKFEKLFGPEPRGEVDHIVPFSEGGQTVEDNLRLLCNTCHRKRTAEWHAERARQRKGALVQLQLVDTAASPS